ncbi:hypothetical protein [Leucobacter chromiiresistens]|uniref:BetR domain-containing protein n=2 Tax=Leucobacter chromiiresistens TaxID=1079994 RepID=A0A1H1BC86_9MICO|nr:hypothetical protein [Leucobacter chromiiresistens]SDQ49555.1 hypothetical protein SAMN04488565_2727 [Leucobacter chromiiresistens]
METIVTAETVQETLRQHVGDSPRRHRSIAALAGIPLPTFTRKLAAKECPFTVRELANIAFALGIKVETFWQPVPVKDRKLQRGTEPGEPDQQGVGGGL